MSGDVLAAKPAHVDAGPSDHGARFWANIDADPNAVVLVVGGPDGRLLGTFSTYARAYDHALRNSGPGEPATLIPQVIDAPEWGNTVMQ